MTPSESLQVGMTQYHTGHKLGVTLLLLNHESSVTSHGSRKETVWVTSRFRDIITVIVNGEDNKRCLHWHNPLIMASSSQSWTSYPLSAGLRVWEWYPTGHNLPLSLGWYKMAPVAYCEVSTSNVKGRS
jgi:hypothetical protein